MTNKNIDDTIQQVVSELEKLWDDWRKVLGLKFEADLFIEKQLAETKNLVHLTDSETAAVQCTRLTLVKLRIMRFLAATQGLIQQLAFFAAAFTSLAEKVAEEKFEEVKDLTGFTARIVPDEETLASAEDIIDRYGDRDPRRRFGPREP